MNNNLLIALLVVLALLVGGVFGSIAFPVTNEVIVTKEVQVDRVVEVPVEVTVEVPVDSSIDYLGNAVDEFMDEFLDEDDDLRCGFNTYDENEVSISKVYDEYSLNVEDLEDGDYEVEFTVKVKYDEDDERSCRETFDVSVLYEEDERPEVEYNRQHH